MFNRLYVRIWLAVVLALVVLTLLVGWVWRLAADPPLRDVVIRNEAGEIIGRGHPRFPLSEGELRERLMRHIHRQGGPLENIRPKLPHPEPDGREAELSAQALTIERADGLDKPGGAGVPEFELSMHDGQRMRMRLLHAPPSQWSRAPFGFAWMLVWVSLAVALATFPIVRKLTRRLESLQNGVQQWGEGDLSIRVPEQGEDEVAFLAKRFNQAAQHVQTLVQSHEALLASQKSLLANASHELRSPLTRIRMGLELIGPSATPAFRDEISRNITELDQLIEEILLASRLDAHEADLGTIESVDLIGLAAEEGARVNADLEVLNDASDASTAPLTDLCVQGVAKLLRRAVRNLLENARRYGAGDINLYLSRQDGLAVIRVGDHGPGVPPDLRERIFEPFYRLPGATERDGGVGLGLALVKSIAQRHGGRVFCENRPEGGACFVLELPLNQRSQT